MTESKKIWLIPHRPGDLALSIIENRPVHLVVASGKRWLSR